MQCWGRFEEEVGFFSTNTMARKELGKRGYSKKVK